MNIYETSKLIKTYADCPECGNNKVGGGMGSLQIEDEVFSRSCQCGWSVTVDRRIKYVSIAPEKKGGKLVGGTYEVIIHGQGRKHLPLLEMKEKSGVKRINQHDLFEKWLNTENGREWALQAEVKI